jgi:hypothetical protein
MDKTLLIIGLFALGFYFLKLFAKYKFMTLYPQVLSHFELISNTILSEYFTSELLPYKMTNATPTPEYTTKKRSEYITSVLHSLSRSHRRILRYYLTQEGIIQYLVIKFDNEALRNNIQRAERSETTPTFNGENK